MPLETLPGTPRKHVLAERKKWKILLSTSQIDPFSIPGTQEDIMYTLRLLHKTTSH